MKIRIYTIAPLVKMLVNLDVNCCTRLSYELFSAISDMLLFIFYDDLNM